MDREAIAQGKAFLASMTNYERKGPISCHAATELLQYIEALESNRARALEQLRGELAEAQARLSTYERLLKTAMGDYVGDDLMVDRFGVFHEFNRDKQAYEPVM